MPQFTPPDIKVPRWATYIPDRRPQFKMHTSKGLAKSALSIYADWGRGSLRVGVLYEHVEGEWVERANIEPHTPKLNHPLWADTQEKEHRSYHKREAEYGERYRREGRKPSRYMVQSDCPFCGEPDWKLMGYSEMPCTDSTCIHC
jgi:hypothetical protein